MLHYALPILFSEHILHKQLQSWVSSMSMFNMRINKSKLTLLIIKGCGPSLIGRNWMSYIRFNWSSIKLTRSSTHQNEIESLVKKYPSVFEDKLGAMKKFTTRLDVKQGSKLKFFRPRPVPFALPSPPKSRLNPWLWPAKP